MNMNMSQKRYLNSKLNKSPESGNGINDESRMLTPDNSSSSESESDGEGESEVNHFSATKFQENLEKELKKFRSNLQAVQMKSQQTGEDFIDFQDHHRKEREIQSALKMNKLQARLEQLRLEDLETAAQLETVEKELEEIKLVKTPSWKQAKADLAKTTSQLGKYFFRNQIITIILICCPSRHPNQN